MMDESILTQLQLLRAPFLDHQIGHLPRAQVKKDEYDRLPKSRCDICGGWHPKEKTVHLAYVGHAALTDRLLDVDPAWDWQPLAFDEVGLPLFDKSGGLWIRLTVCGVTKLGYGNAKPISDQKEIGSREKEVIGDALRNAAMRFGAALELWHKGDLHQPEPEPLPAMEDDKFNAVYAKMEASIMAGKKTSQQWIDHLSTTNTLTDKQKEAINNIG